MLRYNAVRYEVRMNRQMTETTTYESRRGIRVEVRPLTRADVPNLLDIFAHMGPDSRYNRFQQVATNPDPELVQQRAEEIAVVTVERGQGWVAFVNRDGVDPFPVGAVRYIYTGPGTAEIAVSVRDDFQQQGIGKILVQHAVAYARTEGLRCLLASVLPDNRAALALMRSLELPYSAQMVDGVREFLLDITGP
jgi:RimJ/RimL family protein N-acetyltransferase